MPFFKSRTSAPASIVSSVPAMLWFANTPSLQYDERPAGQRVLVAEGLIAERVVRRRVVAVKGQRAEALIAERALDFGAAVERPDRRRVEDQIGRRREPASGRARPRRGVDERRALREERPVLHELALELLRRDRLLIDLDVREIRVQRSDEANRRRDRIADVAAVPAHRASARTCRWPVGRDRGLGRRSRAHRCRRAASDARRRRRRGRNCRPPKSACRRKGWPRAAGASPMIGSHTHERCSPRAAISRTNCSRHVCLPPRGTRSTSSGTIITALQLPPLAVAGALQRGRKRTFSFACS